MSKSKKLENNPDANLAQIGNYIFQKTVGEGNFAKVKLAKHKITHQEVAIKIIDKTTMDEKKLSKLYREVRIMKLLHHPNIVKLYEVIETKFTIFLVMEYVSGGELYDYLVVHGRMKEKEARAKFRQILSAVFYCHKKRVIHRDLKAENLLLDGNLDIKIADFGFSNQFDPDGKLDTFCGSPPYAAPELFQGKRYTGPEVDVWSLGVILYVLTTGCLPFDGKNLQEMRESVCRGKYRIPFYLSEGCEKLLRKFLVRDPSKRPSLDVLLDDSWLNEGYENQSLFAEVPEQLVQEDNLIMSIMETKFAIDRDTLTKGLRNNIYDETMSIYFLLYNEKMRHGEAAVIKIGEQMAIKPSGSHSSTNSRATSPDQPRKAANNDGVAPPVTTIHEESDNADSGKKDAPVQVVPRANARTKVTRRNTVSGEAEVTKMAESSAEEAGALRMLKELQVKAAEEKMQKHAHDSPAAIPRSRHTTDAPRARPVSVAVPDENYVPHSAFAESNKSTVTSDADTSPNGDGKESGRKRTNTLAGFLKIKSKQTTQPGTPQDSPLPDRPTTADSVVDDSNKNLGFGPEVKPRSLRFTFNSNTTSSKAPDEIVQEVVTACQKHNIGTKLVSRYLIECTAPPPTSLPGAEDVKIEIEICKLPRLRNLHGLRFKRIGGASADYKTVSEQVLGAIQL